MFMPYDERAVKKLLELLSGYEIDKRIKGTPRAKKDTRVY